MSIHFITGKPGGGKSMYAVKLVLEELRFGSRVVITNLPLNVGRLNEYLQDSPKPIDVINRIRILSDEETAEFWLHRPSWKGERLSDREWSSGKKPQYVNLQDSGVFYVIDEVHNFFGARQWAETGRDVLYYLSQHRKLGDTVVCVTQSALNVDRQFRSVAQDFTTLKNVGKLKAGLIKLPNIFLRKTYPSLPGDNSVALESGTFRLDVRGLGSLYDTSAGVGIHGRAGADIGERRKGIHWSFGIAAVVIGGALFLFGLPRLLAKGIASDLHIDGKRQVAEATTTTAPTGSRGGGQESAGPPSTGVRPPVPMFPVATNAWLTGVAQLGGGRVLVALSTGQTIEWPSDLGLTDVRREYVIYEGIKYVRSPIR